MVGKAIGRSLFAFVACFGLVIGCSSGSSSSKDDAPAHSISDADVQTAISAWGSGSSAAGKTNDNTTTAYYVTNSSGMTLNFNKFVSGSLTLTGVISVDTSTTNVDAFSGTLTISGSTVKSMIISYAYNTLAKTYTGTETFAFSDGSSWTYNLATSTFSKN